VLETPGHSPESISILVYDLDQSTEVPYAVLTGDTLFIGDVGRPDLHASLGWSAGRLPSMLYDSLHHKLAQLPDETLVYPAHGAGSLCGKKLSTDAVSTIGEQRRSNYALAPMSRERFIEFVTADQPDTPAYFGYDAVLNARERETLERALELQLRPLTPARVLELTEAGAQLLDTRDPAEFADAHLRGAVNVGLGGAYATWCGTILDSERAVVLVAEPGRELEAATRPADRVRQRRRLPRRGTRALDDAAELIECTLLQRLADEMSRLPSAWPTVVYCTSGYRSAIACSLTRRRGRAVSDPIGGIGACQSTRPTRPPADP
jgi:rhodanese-related sulfurtransferase